VTGSHHPVTTVLFCSHTAIQAQHHHSYAHGTFLQPAPVLHSLPQPCKTQELTNTPGYRPLILHQLNYTPSCPGTEVHPHLPGQFCRPIPRLPCSSLSAQQPNRLCTFQTYDTAVFNRPAHPFARLPIGFCNTPTRMWPPCPAGCSRTRPALQARSSTARSPLSAYSHMFTGHSPCPPRAMPAPRHTPYIRYNKAASPDARLFQQSALQTL
jgi:hypothetical protein